MIIPYLTALTTYFSYGLLFAFGQLRDFFRKSLDWWSASTLQDLLQQMNTAHLVLKKCTPSTCSTRVDGGTTKLHAELEECVSNFVGKPASIVFGMGYVTNSAILPVLIGKGGLIISDSLNHNSIVNGARGSGAPVQVFQHNTPSHLENVLREQIADGQPRTHRPWKKIIVVVEGIYCMEGELCKLPEIVSICKKYKAFVYLDEAHSIGAVGQSGRGVCELLGVDTADVDIMMGTFTKSFGSCGGYIAGSKELIEYLKYTCPAHLYATSISAPAAQQIISSIKVVLGEDGSSRGAQKLARIRENSNLFRSELQKMGFEVAVVRVAFPATPLLLAHARICISASRSREDLLKALEVMSTIGDMVGVKYFPAEPNKQQAEVGQVKVD
ncbi:hypothetical protein SASPL_154873 [Salvia splendens]|uniref:serine C-palmitoyltransferase n=1 Tax=Salvia splendens TaxID=180675 RepID=A0A8X8W144_SALSN|nr:hypothetical protein SASPL_154873 [Salvia splendens]